jgi:hypothetical protein
MNIEIHATSLKNGLEHLNAFDRMIFFASMEV